MKISHHHPQNWTVEERTQQLLGVHRRCVTALRSSTYMPEKKERPPASVRGR